MRGSEIQKFRSASSAAATVGRALALGAAHGWIAWTSYWVGESFFSSLLPRMIEAELILGIPHGRVSVLLLLLYMAAGLGFGVALGAIFGLAQVARYTPPSRVLLIATRVTVLLAFSVAPVLALGHDASTWAILAAPFLFTTASASIIWSDRWFRRLRFLVNPWVIAFGLPGVPWITEDALASRSHGFRGSFGIVCLIAFVAFAWLLHSVLASRKPKQAIGISLFSRREFAATLGITVSVLGILLLWDRFPRTALPFAPGPASRGGPNIVLVTLDTVRADHMPLYGYNRDTTPRLREFSTEATLYLYATATAEHTLPSHASLFTGEYPSRHRAYCDRNSGFPLGRPLRTEARTLAEYVTDRGYLTIGVVANHAYLTPDFQLDQGFQYYSSTGPIPLLAKARKFYVRSPLRGSLMRFIGTEAFDTLFRNAEEINNEVLPLIEKLQWSGRPFLLFVNYMDAHAPYVPPRPFDRRFPGKSNHFTYDHYCRMSVEVGRLDRTITAEEYRHYVSQYDGAIAYVDQAIGRIIDSLKTRGLYDSAMIIITSDHGEAFGEKNMIEHSTGWVYQNQIEIPLLVKYPGQRTKRVVRERASQVDVLPTVLRWVGVDIPSEVQGHDLEYLPEAEPRDILSEGYPPEEPGTHPRFTTRTAALFFGPWKLIRPTPGREELYNLACDRAEQRDLHSKEEAKVRELAVKLDRALAVSRVRRIEGTEKLTKKALDRLKSLGYVQ